MQMESKNQIKCTHSGLKLSNVLLCNTSLLTYFNWKRRQTRTAANKLRYKFDVTVT